MVATDAIKQKPEELKKSGRWWPIVVASSLAGAALMFRGCWHGRMGWPLGAQGYSYQVCLNCGAMRLFDEKVFSAFGPFRNNLEQLIEWQESRKPNPAPRRRRNSHFDNS